MDTPLVDDIFLLQKIPGKGGWTYAALPGVKPDVKNPFGWRQVRGLIDQYEIKNYKLMPMGNGSLFLPVKASIRKQIGKKEGDFVKVILFEDDSPLEIPDEFLVCLKDEPTAHLAFFNLSDSYKKRIIDWIYQAKKESTRVERIVVSIQNLISGKKLLDK